MVVRIFFIKIYLPRIFTTTKSMRIITCVVNEDENEWVLTVIGREDRDRDSKVITRCLIHNRPILVMRLEGIYNN